MELITQNTCIRPDTYLFGTMSKVDKGGVSIDVKRDIDIPLPIDGNTGRSIDYMNVSGLGSSSWESSILGGFFSMPTVSAVKLLNAAYKQGIPIYTITSSNMNTILSQLNVDPSVISAIQNAINAGYEVIISQTNVQYYDWNGVGYIVYDPSTGAGGYMINGGLMGAGTACPLPKPGASDPPGQTCPSTVPLTSIFAVDSYGQTQLTSVARNDIVDCAASQIGAPYIGGCPYGQNCQNNCSPLSNASRNCFDCSGLVAYCYSIAGFKQFEVISKDSGTKYSGNGATRYYNFLEQCGGITAHPQDGDIYFFAVATGKNKGYMDHVAIAFADGSGFLIDASQPIGFVFPRTIDDVIRASGNYVTLEAIGDLLDNSYQCQVK